MENENGIKTEKKPYKKGAKGYFLVGTAPGPGRPKGSKSIKDAVRKYLEDHPNEFQDFIAHFIKKNRELAWQMLEGRPKQDLTSDDKPLQPLIVKILDGEDDGDSEGVQPTS